MKSNKTRTLAIIVVVPNKNPKGYKERIISFIVFAFGEGVTIFYWQANMNLYVSDIEESYKDTIISHLVNSGTVDLLLQIVQCRYACAVDE